MIHSYLFMMEENSNAYGPLERYDMACMGIQPDPTTWIKWNLPNAMNFLKVRGIQEDSTGQGSLST